MMLEPFPSRSTETLSPRSILGSIGLASSSYAKFTFSASLANLPSNGGTARKETGTNLECLVPKPEINARRLNLVIINWNWRDNPSGVSENVGANCLRGQNTRGKRLQPGKKF